MESALQGDYKRKRREIHRAWSLCGGERAARIEMSLILFSKYSQELMHVTLFHYFLITLIEIEPVIIRESGAPNKILEKLQDTGTERNWAIKFNIRTPPPPPC